MPRTGERAFCRGDHLHGRDPRETAEVARRAHPLIARTAGQIGDFDRLGHQRSIPPRRGSHRQRRSIQRDNRDGAGRCDVERSAVASDEQHRALEQPAKFRKRELAERHHPFAIGGRQSRLRPWTTRPAASRSDGPAVTITDRPGSREAREATRAANALCGQRRNGLPALTWTTTSRSVNPTPALASRPATAAVAPGSTGISTGHLASSGPAIPTVVKRSHWFCTACRGRSCRGRATRFVYIHARPATSYPTLTRAPLSQVSKDARGPP